MSYRASLAKKTTVPVYDADRQTVLTWFSTQTTSVGAAKKAGVGRVAFNRIKTFRYPEGIWAWVDVS